MKKLIFLMFIAISFACIREDFDRPPVYVPQVDFESNTTIAELKSMYSGNLDSIADEIIIQGIIIANDESGNIYKKLFIRDHTGGIEINIDKTALYNEYRLGQRIYVKCKGMFIGRYGGVQQLGYKFNNTIGRLPASLIPQHIFRDSLPGPAPQPTVLTIPSLTSNHISTLIRLDNVYFETPGATFTENNVTTNRTLFDIDGNSIIVRTSNYADFALSKIPDGVGSVVAILSSYNGTYQLYLRSFQDLINFDSNAPMPQVLFQDNFSQAPGSQWLIYSVSSNKDWTYNATEQCMEVNGYQGDAPSNDWLMFSVNLQNISQPSLQFKTWTRYTDANITQPLKVFVSADYPGIGNPEEATWTELQATFPAPNSQTWTSSGLISLAAYQGQQIFIGFQYKSSGTGSNTSSQWRLDDVVVKGFFQ